RQRDETITKLPGKREKKPPRRGRKRGKKPPQSVKHKGDRRATARRQTVSKTNRSGKNLEKIAATDNQKGKAATTKRQAGETKKHKGKKETPKERRAAETQALKGEEFE
ncbi:hypothetical protein, partial [Klebsiella pneumoniae]|uniref:hypothetical protein n=1 Tax=Klebsiella pneumoniae TaxID=573 RepID=UPI003B5AFED0